VLSPATTSITKRWSFRTGDYVFSSPAVANGVVYVGSDDRTVYALDAATGAKRWSFRTGESVDSSPAVANGVVYVGSDDGTVYALDAATGAKRWSFRTGGFDSSPAVALGRRLGITFKTDRTRCPPGRSQRSEGSASTRPQPSRTALNGTGSKSTVHSNGMS